MAKKPTRRVPQSHFRPPAADQRRTTVVTPAPGVRVVEAPASPGHLSMAEEYGYVRRDLLRIFILATLILGGMVALRFSGVV